VSDPRSILLLTKPRYIGDTVVATAAFRALATRYPDADMDLLTGASAAEAIEGCPYLRSVEVLSRSKRRSPVTMLRQAARLRKRRYDMAVLFDRSLRSALLCFLARIPRRVGFAVEYRGPLLTSRVSYDVSQPELDCLLRLAEAAGAPAAGRETELWVSDEERRAVLDRYSLSLRPIVSIAPAANDAEVRQWPAEHFIEVGRALAMNGYTPVLLGAAHEIEASDAVHAGLRDCAVNLAGRTTVRDAVRLISASSLFVASDTGMTHCAVGLRTPCVTIYGPTKAHRWGHANPRSEVLWTPAPGGTPTPGRIRDCIRSVTPEAVLQAAERVMQEVPHAAP
jgi:heptosyltransferase-2